VYSDFYEILLPALRFEKVEETDTKVNDTEENDTFQIDHVRRTQENVRNDRRRSAKKSRFTCKETTRTGTQTLPEQRQISTFKRQNRITTEPTTLIRSEQRI
jgi:hypothetical protein